MWLPPAVAQDPEASVRTVARDLLTTLSNLSEKVRAVKDDLNEGDDEDANSNREDSLIEDESAGLLLNFLFDNGVLPTYAFPRSLCSFLIERT